MTNPKEKKMLKFTPPPPLFPQPSSPSFSSLPDEIVESFLARLPRFYYQELCLVSKSFYSLVSSPKIYNVRSHIGVTEPCLYVCLRSPRTKKHIWFTLINHSFEGLPKPLLGDICREPVRVSSSCDPARLNSTSVIVGFEIYQMGGTVGGKRSKDVDVLDCRSHTWRRAADLTVARKSAKSCFLDGKIYVTGGGEEESEMWGEVLDIKSQTWKPLGSPSESERGVEDYQVVVLGGRLWVITKQKKKYAYDPKEERWVEDVVGFVGLVEPVISGPCCVIDNVLFAEHDRKLKWYDPRYGDWLMVEDLSDLYGEQMVRYRTVQLVNHAGKLVIIWHQLPMFLYRFRSPPYAYRKIWCAVIRLEERVDPLGTHIRGYVERCNAVVDDIHKSFNLLTCQSLSM